MTSTSNAFDKKLERAVNQLENVERIIASAPKYIYKDKENFIERTRQQIKLLAHELERELSKQDDHIKR